MKNLKDKLSLIKIVLSIFYQAVRFRIKIFFYETCNKANTFKVILSLAGFVIFLFISFYLFLSPPKNFPVGESISIEKGFSLQRVSSLLKSNDVIRSKIVFKFFVIITGGEKRIRPAFYVFEQPMPVFRVAWQVSGRKSAVAPISVTIPEGFDSKEIADAFAKKLPSFQKEQFLLLAESKEGTLFPDTYFFLYTDGAEEALRAMSENYDKKILPFREDIAASGRTEREIITMASIVEGEANGDEDRALIAGILWKRWNIGMPLQADAAPITYKEKDLPKEPISNPGLKAIEAALYPEATPYLYYLHDENGAIHYAKNFKEHTENKRQYLK